MATVTTANPADFANRLQAYFNPKLLKACAFNLILGRFGETKDYPIHGTTVPTIRFFRPRPANTTGVGAITENTTSTTKTEVAVGYVDVTLGQRGGLSEITDIVQAIDLLETLKLYVETMGADAALDFDTVIRACLISGILNSDLTYKAGPTGTKQAYFERFGGVVNTGVSATDFGTLSALTPAQSKMTRIRHLGMVTQLKDARVPKLPNGKFVAAVSPVVMNDVRQDTDWLDSAKRVDGGKGLFRDDTIELDGAVFVENDNTMIEDETYGTYDDVDNNGDGLIYSSFYLGAGAFGVPGLTNKRAGGSPMSPKMVILAQPDKSDPQNLKTVISWKAMYGAKAFITNVTGEVPHYGILRTKATF